MEETALLHDNLPPRLFRPDLPEIRLCSHHARNMRLLQFGFVPQTS
jgi:hypothetical protein